MFKFKDPRPIYSTEIQRILAREVKKQETEVVKMSKKDQKEFAEICKACKKTGLPEHLVCKKLLGEKHLGSGIFLHPNAKPLKKGEIIGAYSGKVFLLPQNLPGDSCYVFSVMVDMKLNRAEQRKLDPTRPFRPNRHYALDIDAENEGNFIRFVNHSSNPNVEAEYFSIGKNKYGLSPTPIELIYIAKKTINPGEQLLVSYEAGDNSYWANMEIDPFAMGPKTFFLSKSLKVCFSKNK